MLMKMRRPPWKVLSVSPSEAFARVRNPSFLPAATLKNVIIVTNPSPPIWISSIITTCPNAVQLVKVSVTISPVTQVADTAVNRQSKNGVPPLFDEIGSHSSSAPVSIIARNPMHRVCAGRSCFVFFFITGMAYEITTLTPAVLGRVAIFCAVRRIYPTAYTVDSSAVLLVSISLRSPVSSGRVKFSVNPSESAMRS